MCLEGRQVFVVQVGIRLGGLYINQSNPPPPHPPHLPPPPINDEPPLVTYQKFCFGTTYINLAMGGGGGWVGWFSILLPNFIRLL